MRFVTKVVSFILFYTAKHRKKHIIINYITRVHAESIFSLMGWYYVQRTRNRVCRYFLLNMIQGNHMPDGKGTSTKKVASPLPPCMCCPYLHGYMEKKPRIPFCGIAPPVSPRRDQTLLSNIVMLQHTALIGKQSMVTGCLRMY